MAVASQDRPHLRFITGWFSPIDPTLMIEFYESSHQTFEAHVIKTGVVTAKRHGADLATLETVMINEFGGSLRRPISFEARPPHSPSLMRL